MYSDDWKTPQDELLRRCQVFQRHLTAQQIDMAIIVQNADLFYLTGSIQQGMLFVPCSGSRFIVSVVIWTGHVLSQRCPRWLLLQVRANWPTLSASNSV